MSKNKIDDLLNSVGNQQTKLGELEQYYEARVEWAGQAMSYLDRIDL